MAFKSALQRIAIGALLTLPLAVLSGDQKTSPGWRHVRTVGQVDMVVVDAARAKDKDLYRAAAGSICGPKVARGFCKVLFWSNEELVPLAMPMSDDQAKAMRANWTWNGKTGHRELLFACDIEPAPKRCLGMP